MACSRSSASRASRGDAGFGSVRPREGSTAANRDTLDWAAGWNLPSGLLLCGAALDTPMQIEVRIYEAGTARLCDERMSSAFENAELPRP